MIFSIVVGCSDNKKNTNTTLSDAKAKEVVVSVDGRTLTRGELLNRSEMMLKLRQMQNKGMKVSEVNKIRKELIKSYPKFFIEHAIWANYADSEGIQIDKKLLDRVRMRAVRSVIRGKQIKYSALRSKFGTLAPVLDDHVRMMALTASAKTHLCKLNPTNFPPEFAANVIKQTKDYNARMALTNVLVYARATNCWEKLKANADFGEMVSEYSELEQERVDNGKWGTLDYSQLEPDETLSAFVKQHGPGEISPPLEGDNGLMILRIDAKKGSDCTLSRIYFRLPMFADVLTEEQILKQALDKHNSKLISKKFKKLKRAAKIVRPGRHVKKAKPKALTAEEKKALAEKQKVEDELKESVKKEVFSTKNPVVEPKVSK